MMDSTIWQTISAVVIGCFIYDMLVNLFLIIIGQNKD